MKKKLYPNQLVRILYGPDGNECITTIEVVEKDGAIVKMNDQLYKVHSSQIFPVVVSSDKINYLGDN